MRWAEVKRTAFDAVERGDQKALWALMDEHPRLKSAYDARWDTLLHVAARCDVMLLSR